MAYEKYGDAVSVRLKESMVKLLKRRAASLDQRPSEWIRQVITKELQLDTPEAVK